MATLSLVNRGTNHITVKTSLDDTYPNEGRTITFSIIGDYTEERFYGPYSLAAYTPSYTFKFYDLIPGEEYSIRCVISGIQTSPSTQLLTLIEETRGSSPRINEFSVSQAAIGNKEIKVWWNTDNTYYGITTYEVLARKSGTEKFFSKISGVIEDSTVYVENFTVDEFGDYEFQIIFDTNGYSDTATYSLTVKQYKIPIINSFSVQQVEEYSKEIVADWSIDNPYYGITHCEIQARKSSSEKWWPKLSWVSSASSKDTTFTVDDYGMYEFRLVVTTGDYVVVSDIIYLSITEPIESDDINPKIYCLDYWSTTTIAVYWKTSTKYINATCELYMRAHSSNNSNNWEMQESGNISPSREESLYCDLWRLSSSFIGSTVDIYIKAISEDGSQFENSEILTFTIRNFAPPTNLITERGCKSLSFMWDDIPEATRYTVNLTRKNDSKYINVDCDNNFITFNDELVLEYYNPDSIRPLLDKMDYSVEYNINVRAWYNNSYYIGECKIIEDTSSGRENFSFDVITAPAPPVINLSHTDSKIYIDYGVVDTSTITTFCFELYNSDGTCLETKTVNVASDNKNPSGSIVFDSQCAEGTYKVRAYTVTSGVQCITQNGKSYIESYITVEDSALSLWDWEIGTGSARDKAYQAITNQGYLSDFSYLVWNDLIDKVMDVIHINTDNGVRWYTSNADNTVSYLSYTDTKMSNNDKIITADRFNALRFNIGSRISTGISDQKKGDIIYGKYFKTLASCLNAWIVGTGCNYVTYPLNTSGRPDGTPPLELDAGGYYYKYTYNGNWYTVQAVTTDIDFSNVTMKFDEEEKNNGYVFLSCIGTKATPPEFGMMTAPDLNGVWYCYTKESGSNVVNRHDGDVIFEPDDPDSDVYTYHNAGKITMRIRLSGSNIIGQILKNGEVIVERTVSGSSTNIGESANTNTFLLGTSFVPNPSTKYCGNRDAYLKGVRLQNGYLYEKNSYNTPTYEWVPDANNDGTYYAVVVRPEYLTYNRLGNLDEEINISYE